MVPVSGPPLLEPPLLLELEMPLLEPEPELLELETPELLELPPLLEEEPEMPLLELEPPPLLLLEAPPLLVELEAPPLLELELAPSVPPSAGSRAVTPPQAPEERSKVAVQPTTSAKLVVFMDALPGKVSCPVLWQRVPFNAVRARGTLSGVKGGEARAGRPAASTRATPGSPLAHCWTRDFGG
jgi:hypothetical protein